MKQLIIVTIFTILLPVTLLAQDSIPQLGTFDEGDLFVGPDDVLKFKGYAQLDAYFPIGKSPGISEFLVREARFAATGFFQQKFRYMLNASYDKGKAELNEAFLESRHLSFAKIRVGQFKVPFSLSNLTSSSQLDVVDRSFIIENFSPSYDIGAMVFGEDKHKLFAYALGVFNGRDLNEAENNSRKFIIGRVVIAPFISARKSAFSKIYLGCSFANGVQKKDLSLASYKTITETPVFNFSDSIIQNGITTIYGFDLEWLVKSFSLKGEYLNYKAENVNKNTTNHDFATNGYYVIATFLITGEDKKRNDFIKSKKEFNPKKGNWGALELATRYERAKFSSSILTANIANVQMN